MAYETSLANGTEVEFNVQAISGRGRICGVAATAVALLGETYIVEILPPTSIHDYPYSHIAVPRLYLKVVNPEDAKQETVQIEKETLRHIVGFVTFIADLEREQNLPSEKRVATSIARKYGLDAMERNLFGIERG